MTRFFTKKNLLAKLMLGGFVLGSTPVLMSTAAIADIYEDQVRAQLDLIANSAGVGRETHEPFIGSLGNGGTDNITLHLRQGVTYSLVGVCDQDCSDLDLVLYDDNGNTIDTDYQPDDYPVVTVTPRWNARFTVNVQMVECSVAPCRFGLGAFGN